MEEKVKTRVIFKMTKREVYSTYTLEPECIAFLLDCDVNLGRVMSYMHVGQHSEATIEFMYDNCILATPEEYADLKSELESIGYDLLIRTRWRGMFYKDMTWTL